jgi:hypothetical protein
MRFSLDTRQRLGHHWGRMDGDRPITRREDDRLGFAPIAEHLARAIVHQPTSEGLVFGIEGKWGSGKSTLIHLTIEALRSQGEAAPEVILFSPWLVGNRNELLHGLFDELATAAARIDPIETALPEADKLSIWRWLKRKIVRDAHWKLRQKELLRKRIGGKLRAFGNIAGGVGRLAGVAGPFGFSGGNQIAAAIEMTGETARGLFGPATVSKRKSDLVDALRSLSRRVVVFIDDLDRLEPGEASEVLRLVRAVADFPNVIYVLSYDPEVVAQTLTKAVQVDDGASFLEKIVQVSFRVPRPEAFDLRRWFQAEVFKLFSTNLAGNNDNQVAVRQRLVHAIDVQGGRYLNTARDVVRVLNALRLHAMPVHSLVDISDMVWLQLIKIGNPAFYGWIEEYLTEVAAIANGATISDEAKSVMVDRLRTIVDEEKVGILRSVIELSEILPGLDSHAEQLGLFDNLRGNQLNQFVAFRRLGSPAHYRYYFAFGQPAGSLPDEQVQAFIDVAERAPPEAIRTFADLGRHVRPQGGTMAEVLIDRLIAWSDRIAAAAIKGILASFANAMDQVALSSGVGDFGEYNAWHSAERAVTALLKRVAGDVRAACIRTLFTEGAALGWLTHILRSEIFAHGHYGDHARPEDQWLLTTAEFDDVLATMLRRYCETPAAELMRVPVLLDLLFAWKQGSGTEEARQWAETQTETDSGLLTFLARTRTWAASSNVGVYHPLKRRSLEYFLDYDRVVQRLRLIAANANASETDRRLAEELLTAVEQDRDHG